MCKYFYFLNCPFSLCDRFGHTQAKTLKSVKLLASNTCIRKKMEKVFKGHVFSQKY